MEDQLQRLVEKGKAFKAKREELLGKANPDETATSPTLEVDQKSAELPSLGNGGGESHKEGPKKKKIVVIKKIKTKKGKDQVPKAARPTTEGSQNEKDQDMQPTEQDMQPKMPGGDQDKHDHDLLSKGTERSMDTQDTMPYEPYEGAYSQWREEDETNWDKYQWPPVGWRPSKWNQCYWDNTSKWHVYHSYDWDAYNAQRTPWEDGPNSPDVSTPAKTSVESDTTSPPATVSSSGGSLSRSDSVEALASQLGRAWTGDLVDPLSQDPAVAGDKSTGPNLGVNNGQESEVQKNPGQGENEGKKDEGKEEKAEKARAGEHEDKQSEEKTKEDDNKENAKEGEKEGDNGEKAKEGENGDGEKRKEEDKEEAMKVESNQEQPGDSGGAPAQEAEDEAERARLEEIEERRKAAHARYMRYFRNVRNPSTPPELRKMAQAAHGSKSMNSILYDAWASCSEGQWEKSKFLVSIRERHSTTRRGVRKWLTAPEMDARFGAENGNLIRNRKLLDPELKERETREHPELPGNQEMMQFLTLVDDAHEESHEEELDKLYQSLDESDSSSSSSSSSDKKKKKKKSKKDKKEDKAEKEPEKKSKKKSKKAKKTKKVKQESKEPTAEEEQKKHDAEIKKKLLKTAKKALSDASSKIKWALDLKPNLSSLSDRYASSVKDDVEEKMSKLEDCRTTLQKAVESSEVTEAMVDDCGNARKDLETACEPLKMKKPKKASK